MSSYMMNELVDDNQDAFSFNQDQGEYLDRQNEQPSE